MMEAVDIGKISARGQVAIPAGMRAQMGLEEGSKVLFILEDDTVLLKKVDKATFAALTGPLRRARKKIRESDVNALVHRLRKR